MPQEKQRTILRVDGGGGRDADVNWMLDQGFLVLCKVKNWKWAHKLARSVYTWHHDPKVPGRQLGWVTAPHAYHKPTRQIAVRKLGPKGKWFFRILVFNLPDAMLFPLAGLTLPAQPSDFQILLAAAQAYDLRGGALETTIRGSRQGLGLIKRNKRCFHAQEMLVLLAQLAYNLITWFRNRLASLLPFWKTYGIFRMVRDAFHIPGIVELDAQGFLLQVSLNQAHQLSIQFLQAFFNSDSYELSINLRQI